MGDHPPEQPGQLARGQLKEALVRLADGSRTTAEIASNVGTSKESVNAAVQRHGLNHPVKRIKGSASGSAPDGRQEG